MNLPPVITQTVISSSAFNALITVVNQLSSALSGALSAAVASTTYAPIISPTFGGTVTIANGNLNSTTLGAVTPAAATVTTLTITQLPTSSVGLPTGTIWSDGGILSIA